MDKIEIVLKIDGLEHSLTISSFENVYPVSEDSELLIEALECSKSKNPEKILDVCTGSGICAIAAKKVFPAAEVIAVDIDQNAIIAARQNAAKNNAKITFLCGDLFQPLKGTNIKFDLIFCNPPYLPDDGQRLKNDLQTIDKNIINRFLEEVPTYLKEKGNAYLVYSSLSKIKKAAFRKKLIFKTVSKKNFFFEKLYLVKISKKITH